MKVNNPTKKSIIISTSILGVIIVALIGVNAYFSSISSDENSPPKLPPTTERYQGAVLDKEFGFYEFEPYEEAHFIETDFGTFLPAHKGLNYYYPKIDLTVEEIMNTGIKPKAELKVLFAYYSNKPTKFNEEDCFIVYPIGPYSDTCPILANEIRDFTVKKNQGFIIMANEEFKYNYKILADSNTMATTFALDTPTDEEGWVLRPLAPDVDLYDSRIEAVWLQSGPDEFEEIADFRNIEVERPYKMTWIKIATGSDYEDPYTTR